MENLPTYRLTQSGPEAQEILDQVNLNTVDIEQLKRLYQALTQSEPEIIAPTDTWPVANPEENVIYRVIDRVNTPPQYYSDYMWNGTSMVLMSQYNNAIDNEPTAASNNLVKSGGVYSFVHANGGAYDISAAHAVGGVLATYDDLADALGTNGANVPAAVRKGGMSIKFVLSSDNKYVRYNYLGSSTANADIANVLNWQKVVNFDTDVTDCLLEMESGVVHISSGIPIASTTRARSVKYITSGCTIKLNSGFVIKAIVEFTFQNGVFTYNGSRNIGVSEYSIPFKENCFYKINISKVDDTATISSSELTGIVNTFCGIAIDSRKELDPISQRVISKLPPIELGGFTTNSGVDNTSNTRAKVRYLKSPFSIETNAGFVIKNVALYNIDSNGNYVFKNGVTVNASRYENETDGVYVKVGFCKTDDTQVINMSEYSSIVKTYNGNLDYVCKEISDNIVPQIDETKKLCAKFNSTICNTFDLIKGEFYSESGISQSESRACSQYLIPSPFKITMGEGYRIKSYYRYTINKDGNMVYVSKVIGQMLPSLEVDYDNYFYGVNFCKEDDTATITDSDIPNMIGSFIGSYSIIRHDVLRVNETEKLCARVTSAIFNTLDLTKGEFYNASNISQSDSRARSQYLIPSPFKITMSEGYRVRSYHRYTIDKDGNMVYASKVEGLLLSSLDMPYDEYFYGINFCKEDTAATITDADIPNMISSFISSYSIIRHDVPALLNEYTTLSFNNIYTTLYRLQKFSTYTDLIAAWDGLVTKYSDILSKTELGTCSDGVQKLYEYKLNTTSYNSSGLRSPRDTAIAKPKILIISGVHGYEPASPMSVYVFMKDLLEGHPSLFDIRNNFDIRIIPCVNPWGYNNNRRGNYNNVDINRNCDAEWELTGDPTANPSYYSGPSAASEAETQIFQSWMDSNTDACLFIDFHNSSYNNEVSCFAGTNSVGNTENIKKAYLVESQKLSSYLTSVLAYPENSIFGYTFGDSGPGKTIRYAAKKNIVGGTFETAQNANGSGNNSPITIAVGADAFGTLIQACYKVNNIYERS